MNCAKFLSIIDPYFFAQLRMPIGENSTANQS
jgi:hypothetical protein